ncbi:substrate-binding domain-containing protein [uncultured Subdoligranulum sp.]|uniref:substrate-binding domain-containing protein n=1 Tax=uncultured Subdoligranulum sp. TaxID=512298 RepID=UPI00320A8425
MKRTSVVASVLAASMALSLAACGSTASESTAASSESTAVSSESTAASTSEAASESTEASDFDTDQDITVITREDGSGTRGAFIELTGVEEKNDAGEKEDMTTQAAATQNSTNGVMTAVANDETAIGYISLGSLNDTVKAVTVGGVEATAENVSNGTYTLARPFNIVTNGEPTDPVAVDFIAYCMSPDGQALATEDGYIGGEGTEYTSTQPSGSITVGGSSSVSPLMEKLIEAYKTVNPNATVELLTTDSTTGVTGALDGTYTVGMASRELKDTETAEGAQATVLAMDGIAVVVNPANSVSDLSVDQIKSIYTGEATVWSDLQ